MILLIHFFHLNYYDFEIAKGLTLLSQEMTEPKMRERERERERERKREVISRILVLLIKLNVSKNF